MPKVPPGRYARPMWFATGTVRYIAGTAAPHFWVGTVPPKDLDLPSNASSELLATTQPPTSLSHHSSALHSSILRFHSL